MAKRDNKPLFEQILQIADRLTEGDETKGSSQLASELRQSGIDPDALRESFYKAAKALASRERANGRPASLALQQAIEQMGPDSVMPSNKKAAENKMTHWFEWFSAPFAVPENLQTVRAFRKSGELALNEQAELDELEKQLKEDIRKEHERQT